MKRSVITVFALVLACCVRAADTLQLDSTNMVGMTCFTSGLADLPIGVTYGNYATTNVEMSVTNLIWTGNLEIGDRLYIYDYGVGAYKSMRVIAGGKWKADNVDAGEKIDLDKECFKFGRGAWLCRYNLADREDKNVYTFGQVPVGRITVAIQPGTGTKATATLIASPISEPFDVNGGVIDWSAITLKGDTLRVPKEDGTMQTYSWSTAKKQWYVLSGTTLVTEGLVVPRGRGFWYSRAAKNTTGATLTWNLSSL